MMRLNRPRGLLLTVAATYLVALIVRLPSGKPTCLRLPVQSSPWAPLVPEAHCRDLLTVTCSP